MINNEAREKLDLQFIQTKFSFLTQPQSLLAQKVLSQAIAMYPEINTAKDIKAPTGFIHAYDLTKLLITAIKQSDLKGDKHHDINVIKLALEDLNTPVHGLIKLYQRPYSSYTLDNINAHDSLDETDYAMGYYQADNSVTLLPNISLSESLNEKN